MEEPRVVRGEGKDGSRRRGFDAVWEKDGRVVILEPIVSSASGGEVDDAASREVWKEGGREEDFLSRAAELDRTGLDRSGGLDEL